MNEPEWAQGPDGVIKRQLEADEAAGPYVAGCLSCVWPLGWVFLLLLAAFLGAVVSGLR